MRIGGCFTYRCLRHGAHEDTFTILGKQWEPLSILSVVIELDIGRYTLSQVQLKDIDGMDLVFWIMVRIFELDAQHDPSIT